MGTKMSAWGMTALIICCAGMAAAQEDESVAQYVEWQQELEALVDNRDVDVFELDFHPLDFDRILVDDGLGNKQVYHYLTFRLRNKVSDSAKYLQENASAFNEVMASIVKEYEGVSFNTDEGPVLRVDDATSIEDQRLAKLIDRADLKVKPRSVNITVVAHDENGSRFRLFDEVPGQGPQENFNFADMGDTRYGTTFLRVREAIEERERRRLLSVHEIRRTPLAPYKAEIRDDEGVSQGEVFGVLIFNRWPVLGDQFEVMVQGLSNKLRFQDFMVNESIPEPKDQVQDYFGARILRRTYVMTFSRPGDEHYLDLDKFTMTSKGWEWKPTFNRIARRASMAYAKYFLDNIQLDEERSAGGKPQLHNPEVADAAMAYYDSAVAGLEGQLEGKLAALAKDQDAVRSYYETWINEDSIGAEEVSLRLQRRLEALTAREQELRGRLDQLRQAKPDFDALLKEVE